MKIYLAGKVSKNCWRHRIVDELRSFSANVDGAEWPVMQSAIFGKHDYTGPYFTACDHGCYHGDNLHGLAAGPTLSELQPWGTYYGNGCGVASSMNREHVVSRCKRAIDDADLVFVWMTDKTAFGTLAEIGYARGRDKLIVLAMPVIEDLWFAATLADDVIVIDPVFDQPEAVFRHWLDLNWVAGNGSCLRDPFGFRR